MNKPIVKTWQIAVLDSIRGYSDVDLYNYGFYSHSDSDETQAFMSEVRALDKKLSQQFLNGEYRRVFIANTPESEEGYSLNILNLEDVENV